LYILPSNAQEVTAQDLDRFPPLLLGDEESAQAWLDRALDNPPPQRQRRGILRDILFYVALAAVVVAVFLFRSAAGGAPVTFMGFSAMRVLTASMQAEIPQGSLIITRSVDPDSLEIGDDITYLAGEATTITHRIVGISENFNGSGERAFVTQGIMNETPDELRVPAANVVGKVIFHNLFLGRLLNFVHENWGWLAIMLILFIGLYESLKIVFKESGTGRKPAAKRLQRQGGKHEK